MHAYCVTKYTSLGMVLQTMPAVLGVWQRAMSIHAHLPSSDVDDVGTKVLVGREIAVETLLEQ